MAVSIIHRATGTAMATVGGLLLAWWLVSLSGGPTVYTGFVDVFTVQSGKLNWLGYLFGIGLSWALFQHMGSGVRHLFMDQGANFELGANKTSALLTFAFSIVATAAFWAYLLGVFNG